MMIVVTSRVHSLTSQTIPARRWEVKRPIKKGSDSNPHAIPLFQSCNDPSGKVLAFVVAAMSVEVHDLSPTTELDIHTAFNSAIACKLRRRPLIRVIYRVGTHRRLPPQCPMMLRGRS